MNKLNEIADACNAGACNPSGLLISLGEAVKEHKGGRLSDSAALKIVLGHLQFLCGEGLGPSSEALQEYENSKIPIPLH